MSVRLRVEHLNGRLRHSQLKATTLSIALSERSPEHVTCVRPPGSKQHSDELGLAKHDFYWELSARLKPSDHFTFELAQFSTKGRRKRTLGSCVVFLHRLIERGDLTVTDAFVNDNHEPLQLTITTTMLYSASGIQQPASSSGASEQTTLLPVPHEPSHSLVSMLGARISNKSLWKRVSNRSSVSAGHSCKVSRVSAVSSVDHELQAVRIEIDKPVDGNVNAEPSTAAESQPTLDDAIQSAKPISRSIVDHSSWELDMCPQQFQVCVTVTEARLSGSTMDPCVGIQVGSAVKYTAEYESTHRPVFNEYFVFDFFEPPALFFDKLITFTVYNSKKLLRSNNSIGRFKMDLATVYEQPEHQYYRKWAVLTDRDLVFQAVKGYLKVDVSVFGKGDNMRQLPKADLSADEDNIENNLLVPDPSCGSSMQQARYILRVHGADGLSFDSSYVSSVKRVLLRADNSTDADSASFVRVSFAGHTAETSAKPGSSPQWHEQVVFTEFFPPLVRRIRLQLRTSGRLGSKTVATHWIDLADVSDKGPNGFLPTFGPSYIYLYGEDVNMGSALGDLVGANSMDNIVEGCAYRGRLLVSLHVIVCDQLEKFRKGPPVIVEPCQMVTERNLGAHDTMLLFGCVMDMSMLDKALAARPLHLQVTIGRPEDAAEQLCANGDVPRTEPDGHTLPASMLRGGRMALINTPAAVPDIIGNAPHCSVSFNDRKPCLFTIDSYPDSISRLYHSNVLLKILSFLETSLADVQFLLEQDETDAAHVKLTDTIETFLNMSYQYQNYLKNLQCRDAMNRLDQERHGACERQAERVMGTARKLRAASHCATTSERCHTMRHCLLVLRQMAHEPQAALPDVFITLYSGVRRVAYTRISARSLIHSPNPLERGILCGQLSDLYLKPFGRKQQSGTAVAGLLHAYLWLGYNRRRDSLLDGMPGGYAHTPDVKNAGSAACPPPQHIVFEIEHKFELRCYVYQARSLIAADDIGLSDPFARVIFQGRAAQTRTINETLNPEWNQTLVVESVTLYGSLNDVARRPPVVVVELFDEDQMGDPEPLGHTTAEPHVKLIDTPSTRPRLQWYSIYAGAKPGGELLAAFELIQLTATGDLPPDVPVLSSQPCEQDVAEPMEGGPVINVPPAIRPVMAKYRMEVVFWGLRDLKRVNLMPVERPRVDVEVAGRVLSSGIIAHISLNPNFAQLVCGMDIELPEQTELWPAISIRCYDSRPFGRDALVGVHTVRRVIETGCNCAAKHKAGIVLVKQRPAFICKSCVKVYLAEDSMVGLEDDVAVLEKGIMQMVGSMHSAANLDKAAVQQVHESMASTDLDWWSKYWASVDEATQKPRVTPSPSHKISNGIGNGLLATEMPGCKKFIPKKMSKATRPKDANAKSPRSARGEPGGGKQQRTGKDAAKQQRMANKRNTHSRLSKLKVYAGELEQVEEFECFQDWVRGYELYRGRSDDARTDQERKVGMFKGAIEISKYPLPASLSSGLFTNIPSNEQVNVLIRVYIVKANDLHPMDMNGKADPYLYLTLGKQKFNDKENYISKQLNPVFGKCFEMEALFPHESLLSVQVYDWDLVGRDDLIGETKIDLENRFYSKHRATCGLASSYHTEGYNSWHDWLKPSQILNRLCKDYNCSGPYFMPGQVRIDSKIFTPDASFLEQHAGKVDSEVLSLWALRHWQHMPKIGCHLVPQHVETRPLYHPNKPAIVQGQLEMWVDMFPMNVAGSAKPAVNIAPRKPQGYELRVIIWNTDEVVLEDDELLTGEKCSDIYVTGKLKGQEDLQSTDVHYRSLTGEGNFNWRMIFPFDYLEAEEMMVLTRKESFLSWDESEVKIPPRLELQVWDADNFSADDFLGAVVLDLTSVPRGAKTAKHCTMHLFPDAEEVDDDRQLTTVNLFKTKRMRGWWPMAAKNNFGIYELSGKVEAEIQMLTRDEADRNPAGFGRSEPQPLDPPKRPDNSFLWFVNPMLSARHVLWHNHKWAIVKLLLLALCCLLLLTFVYSLPGFLMRKLLDV